MKLLLIFVVFLLCSNLYGQTTSVDFFSALIRDSDSLRNYVDPVELARSERLGITYTGVKNKFMLANDIQPNVKEEIRKGNFTYEIHETTLEEGYSIVYFIIQQLNDSLRFYFYNGKFTSPTSYLTKNWKTKESKYFSFKISEPKYFNDYCIERLDKFAEALLDSFNCSKEEIELLQKEKLYYIFCTDEKEVGKITTIRSKGQAFLAFDEVITAYQTHFHEVVHLLINFKVKNLGLFTLPFMQEGLAVALGGRGGMAPRVVTDIGFFLQKTNFVSYDSILTFDQFNIEDPASAYAVAGLYNKFLMQELGMERYIQLYKKVNGDMDFVKNIKTQDLNLPSDSRFNIFLVEYDSDRRIFFKDTIVYYSGLKKENIYFWKEDHESVSLYFNGLNNPFSSLLNYNHEKYESRIFKELHKTDKYFQPYLLLIDSTSVRLYNCLYDELIYYYDTNFSIDHKNVVLPSINDKSERYFVLIVKSNIFDGERFGYR